MQRIQSCLEMQACTHSWLRSGEKIVFVPTMGNLHAGHLSLVAKAREVGERVVVSIFINPLQFNESSDYAAYPRTLDTDLQQLASYHVDAVFFPSETELYPHGREAVTGVDVPRLSTMLEGACRPGHFRGVATVLAKLFNLVQPQVAVFGEKDFQQLLVIRQMVADLNFPVEIMGLPTCREADGLAMSSRNTRLTPAEREKAPALYRCLVTMRDKIHAGARDFAQLESAMIEDLQLQGLESEYLCVRAASDLGPPREGEELVILAAVRLGRIRLIDNLRV